MKRGVLPELLKHCAELDFPRSMDRLLAGTQPSLLEVRFLTYLQGAWAGQWLQPTCPEWHEGEHTVGILPKALVALLNHLHHVSTSHGKRVGASLLIVHHDSVLPWNLWRKAHTTLCFCPQALNIGHSDRPATGKVPREWPSKCPVTRGGHKHFVSVLPLLELLA